MDFVLLWPRPKRQQQAVFRKRLFLVLSDLCGQHHEC